MEDEQEIVQPEGLRAVAVGIIAAIVADRTLATSQQALNITRRVVGRFRKVDLADETIQEITLQAIDEARMVITPAGVLGELEQNSSL